MEREIGFYWVGYEGEDIIAKFSADGYWFICGDIYVYNEYEFDYISKNKISR